MKLSVCCAQTSESDNLNFTDNFMKNNRKYPFVAPAYKDFFSF